MSYLGKRALEVFMVDFIHMGIILTQAMPVHMIHILHVPYSVLIVLSLLMNRYTGFAIALGILETGQPLIGVRTGTALLIQTIMLSREEVGVVFIVARD